MRAARWRIPLWTCAILVGLGSLGWGPAAAVSDDAYLYIYSFGVNSGTSSHIEQDRWIDSWILPTDDVPDGAIRANVTVEVRPLNGTGPSYDFAANLEVMIPDPETGRRDLVQDSPRFHWDAPPGVYRLTLNLSGEDGSRWDSAWRTHQVGTSPQLASGWGFVSLSDVSDIDLDGDGDADLRLRDADGKPAPWDFDASTHRGLDHHGREYWRVLNTAFYGNGAPATATVPESVVRSLVGVGPNETVQIQTDLAAPPVLEDGVYSWALPAMDEGDCCGHEVFFRNVSSAPREGLPQSWSDGFRDHINLTRWDLDEDGQPDLRFYDGGSTTTGEARNQTEEERRGVPMTLYAQLRVEHRTTRRVVTFDLERVDGRHDSAWVEIHDASALFRHLLDEEAGDSNTTLHYNVSLPSSDAFVEEIEDRTWVWVGHFSIQQLIVTLVYDEAQDDMPQPPSASRDSVPDGAPSPGAWMFFACAVAALVAFRRRHT